MNHKRFTATFDELRTKFSLSMASNVVLAAAVGLLAWDKVTDEPIIQIVPPTLTTEAKVGASTADAEYLMSWGLYFASMTGNVTPKNVLFVAEAISSFTDPGIYPQLRRQLYALAEDPTFKERGGSITFEAQDISYDAPSNKVFVVGEQVSTTTAGEQNRTRYVYEIEIEMRNRLPVVVGVDHYQGAPRTAKWMRNNAIREERAGRRANVEESYEDVDPWFSEEVRFGSSAETTPAGNQQ